MIGFQSRRNKVEKIFKLLKIRLDEAHSVVYFHLFLRTKLFVYVLQYSYILITLKTNYYFNKQCYSCNSCENT